MNRRTIFVTNAIMMNFNVRLSLWWTIAENISGSIRSGDALSAFIFLLTKKNSMVGFVQGINGIMQLLTSMPAGWLADKVRRDTVLRVGAGVGLTGGAALAYAVTFANSTVAVAFAMALCGAYRGFYNPSLEALFADSVERGRTAPYTWRYVAMIVSSGMGPIVSVVVFLHLGDTWTLTDCRLVVLIGVITMIPALCMMFFFDDDLALPPEDSLTEPLVLSCPENGGTEENGNASIGDGIENLSADNCDVRRDTNCREGDDTGPNGSPGYIAQEESGPPGAAIIVPLLLTLSDFLGALASGMTLKFFPLFFMQVVQLSPVSVSFLSAAAPLGVAAGSLAAQRVSKRVGRVQLSLITRSIDVVLLVVMARIPVTSGSRILGLLIAVHVVRMAVANCTRPLLRSLLNEFVPRRHRAKVNAIDSIRTFSWSGSAALGGILVEKLGFGGTFIVTACVKLAAVIPLFFLIAYVPDGIGAGGRSSAAVNVVGCSRQLRS